MSLITGKKSCKCQIRCALPIVDCLCECLCVNKLYHIVCSWVCLFGIEEKKLFNLLTGIIIHPKSSTFAKIKINSKIKTQQLCYYTFVCNYFILKIYLFFNPDFQSCIIIASFAIIFSLVKYALLYKKKDLRFNLFSYYGRNFYIDLEE